MVNAEQGMTWRDREPHHTHYNPQYGYNEGEIKKTVLNQSC